MAINKSDPLDCPVDGVALKMVLLSNGLHMRVAMSGPDNGIPLVFMHGWPESWFSWRHQLTFFGKRGYRVLAPDMRGYGRTDCPPRAVDYNVFNIASDIIGLLQAHGLSKCVLVGHDWGAILCWQLGHLFPEFFPVLASLSVPYNMRTPAVTDPLATMKRAFGDYGPAQMFFYILYHNERFPGTDDHGPAEAEYGADPCEFIYNVWSDATVPRDPANRKISPLRRDGGFLAHINGRPQHLPAWLSEDDLEYVAEQFKVSGFRGGVNYYRNFATNFQLTPQLINQKIRQPCFFLTGEADVVRTMGALLGAPSESDEDPQLRGLKTVCADLRQFHIIKKEGTKSAGHWIQQERPQEVNESLLSFLQDTADVFNSAPGGPSNKSKM
jgi:pimeloyl-ACP methyl ester carboxylesterase